MAQLQHWSVTCTTCDSPAEYHCNTCGDILCPRCKEIHQKSRGTGHHSIVPYSEKVEPGKLTQCNDHPGNQWLLWCRRCDKAACTECVTSDEHDGHKFVKMAEKIEEQRKFIKEEFCRYSELVKMWEVSLQTLQSVAQAYKNDVDQISKEITKTAERICEQVRNTEVALHGQLQDMAASQISVLQDKEKTLRKEIIEIKADLQSTEEKLRSDNVMDLLYYKAKESNASKPAQIDSPALPVFTLGKVDIHVQSLEAMFGYLSMGEDEPGKNVAEGFTKAPKRGATKSPTVTPQTTKAPIKMSLLPVAREINSIKTDVYYVPLVRYAGVGQSWVRTGEKRLQLMDRRGTVKKTLDTDAPPKRLAITPQGDLLFCEENSKSIKMVQDNGEIRTLFTTDWTPFGICYLHNGDVVVAFGGDGKVVQYSIDGQLTRKLDSSVLRYCMNVTQNKANNHILVCDKSGILASDPGKLIAFNAEDGKVVYEYNGPIDTKFTPCDVCADQVGRVVITDWNNDRIHVLDKEGKFLQYMLTKDHGLCKPLFIDTDADGYAWVSEWIAYRWYVEYLFELSVSRVKVLRYRN